MKILHAFTNMNYVYTKALISLFNEIVEYEQDYYIEDYLEKIPPDILKLSKNISCFNHKSKFLSYLSFENKCKNYDYVVMHFLPNNIFFHILFSKSILRKKIIWRIWGADLYNWKRSGLQWIVINKIRFRTRCNIMHVIAEPMDLNEYYSQFGMKHIFLDGPDPKGYDSTFLEENKCINSSDKIRILIGHSAMSSMNHIIILRKLMLLKEQNIEIVLPLNYGDRNYANKVIKCAIDIFGNEKVVAILEPLTISDYIKLIWNIDIGIFYSDRQIAMGNITMLLYMQKKVLLKKDSVMDNYYRKKEKLDVFTFEDFDFSDFKIKKEKSSANIKFAINEIDSAKIKFRWENTFKKLKEENTNNDKF